MAMRDQVVKDSLAFHETSKYIQAVDPYYGGLSWKTPYISSALYSGPLQKDYSGRGGLVGSGTHPQMHLFLKPGLLATEEVEGFFDKLEKGPSANGESGVADSPYPHHPTGTQSGPTSSIYLSPDSGVSGSILHPTSVQNPVYVPTTRTHVLSQPAMQYPPTQLHSAQVPPAAANVWPQDHTGASYSPSPVQSSRLVYAPTPETAMTTAGGRSEGGHGLTLVRGLSPYQAYVGSADVNHWSSLTHMNPQHPGHNRDYGKLSSST